MVCPTCGSTIEATSGYCPHCGSRVPQRRDHEEATFDGRAGVAVVSDRGSRHSRNEDAADLRVSTEPALSVIAVVADGVSTSVDPDAASALAVQVAADHIAAGLITGLTTEAVCALIVDAVDSARSAVAGLAPAGTGAVGAPACTIVTAVAVAGEVHLSWLGDSRAYWVPIDGPATALTVDDSGAAEAMAAGISPEVAYRLPQAHALTAWLGVDAPPIPPHLASLPTHLLAGGGTLVVCSDGLWNYLEDDALFATEVRRQATASMQAEDGSALDLARRLVDFAVTAGGSDNITVAIVPAAAIVATGQAT